MSPLPDIQETIDEAANEDDAPPAEAPAPAPAADRRGNEMDRDYMRERLRGETLPTFGDAGNIVNAPPANVPPAQAPQAQATVQIGSLVTIDGEDGIWEVTREYGLHRWVVVQDGSTKRPKKVEVHLAV